MPQAKLRQDNIRSLGYVGAAGAKGVYWDMALPGFGLRKFPNGRGSYICSYRIQKRKRLVDLGRSDTITLEQARRKAQLYIGKTKNGEPVLTPLSRAAITRLKMIPLLKGNPYIICGAIPGKPLAYIDKMWRRVRKETGFKDLRIHDLRRTVGSWPVRDGASLHLVGAVLNHKDQKTTAGYAYFQTEDRHKALDRHGKKIVQIASGSFKSRDSNTSADLAVVNTPTQKPPRVRRISRQELYNLIWSEPMITIAKRFGISDRGLTKVCQRSDIPAPPRGYWVKIAAGGAFERPALPNRDDLSSRTIGFRINLIARRQQPLESS